ncbi:putative retinol dehydrogenase 12 [Rhizodiscina lignyota]|uniref:Retinol dehydrogenase 12 n=1 Tax=Rhizodiscina lignyota TaxID=1504668 RepID=A0A9P4MB74_9PEZI|nr:putative retinol dehydrogenase 12 [Rhizodiscina lignyota]
MEFGFHTTAEEAATALSSHIRGRTVLVTGPSLGGIGFETARSIALQNPKVVILAGRSISKLEDAEREIKKSAPNTPTRLLELDLSSLSKVRQAAEEFNNCTDIPKLDVLIANAAVMACPFKMTEDGELQFATNHLGHFLFTQLVMHKIIAAGPGSRIVNVSSTGHRFSDIRWDDINFENGKAYDPWMAYGQSKTANMLYAISLAEKLKPKGIQAFSVHPGGINTNLGRHIPRDTMIEMGYYDKDGNPVNSAAITWKSIGEGASTTIVAAFDPRIADRSGAYLADCKIAEPLNPYAKDPVGAERLWKLSEKLVGQEFDV